MTPSKISPEDISAVMGIVTEIFREKDFQNRIITREIINERITENPAVYPSLATLATMSRRQKITTICNWHFKPYSPCWKTRSWVVTAEDVE